MKKLMVLSLLARLMLLASPPTRSQAMMPQGAESREVKMTAKENKFSPTWWKSIRTPGSSSRSQPWDREHGFEIAGDTATSNTWREKPEL